MIAAAPADEEVAAWLICDHAFQRRYPFGMSKPFPIPVWPYVRSGYLKRGRTLEELAQKCGIDPAGLTSHRRSVQRARRRRRGPRIRSRHKRVQPRAPATPTTSPTLPWRPIEKGPFYAIKVLPGSFGTFAGLKTDPMSRVLDARRRAHSGLYAAGSDQANVMGGHYPSGGINIGPAMTFGYIAGRHAAGVSELRERHTRRRSTTATDHGQPRRRWWSARTPSARAVDFVDRVRAAAAAGFDGIGLRAENYWDAGYRRRDDARHRRATRGADPRSRVPHRLGNGGRP